MTVQPVRTLPATAYAVLGLISFGPMSGYDLKQFADESISHFYWSPAKSQVYAELRRLTAQELVTERHVEQDTRPDKRVYQITDAGRDRLRQWLESPAGEPDVVKNTTLLKVFLGRNMEPGALVRVLRAKVTQAQTMHEMLANVVERCASEEDAFHAGLAAQCGVDYWRAIERWAQDAITSIQDRAAADGRVKTAASGRNSRRS